MDKRMYSLEVKYGQVEKYNSHFHKVKIYVAYAGKNRNATYISRETFERLIPSIYGIPIIGDYHEGAFAGHGGELVINDEGAEFRDTTRAFGYVDSSANVTWEAVEGKDGTIREYLTVEGFLWTGKYPEAIQALNGKHNQSMELTIDNGHFKELDGEEVFEITDGEFLALCILDPEVEPCFEDAKITQFSANLDQDKFKQELTEMVASLKQTFNYNEKEKGGGNLNKKELYVMTNDAIQAVEKAEESKTQKDADDARELVEQLGDTVEEKQPLLDRLDAIEVVKEDEEEDDKEKEQDAEVVEELRTQLEAELAKVKAEKMELETENSHLRAFKAQKSLELQEIKQQEEKDSKIDYINTNYPDLNEQVKELFIAKIDEYENLEDIDADICVYIVKNKVSFAKTKKIKVGVDSDESISTLSPYGNLFK